MADVDIDPFGEHELRPEEATDEHSSFSSYPRQIINLGTRTRARNIIWRRVSKNQTNERLYKKLS